MYTNTLQQPKHAQLAKCANTETMLSQKHTNPENMLRIQSPKRYGLLGEFPPPTEVTQLYSVNRIHTVWLMVMVRLYSSLLLFTVHFLCCPISCGYTSEGSYAGLWSPAQAQNSKLAQSMQRAVSIIQPYLTNSL